MRFTEGVLNMKHVTLCLALVASVSFAAPSVFPYQGRLDKNGVPQSGTFDFRLTLFSAATGGAALWSGDFTAVPVVNGNFSLKIGSTTPLPGTLLAQPTLFLDVQVKGASDSAFRQLAGRQEWLHVPYAASSAGDFRVNGALTVGMAADGGSLVTSGPSETVAGSVRVVTPGASSLDITSQSVNSTTTLQLQPGGGNATFGGAVTATGQVTAPNTWRVVYDADVTATPSTGATFSVPVYGTYKLFYRGTMNTAADSRLLLRVGNGYTSIVTTNYLSFTHGEGSASFNESDASGMYLTRSTSNRQALLAGEVTVQVWNLGSNYFSATSRGEHISWDYSTTGAPIFGARSEGALNYPIAGGIGAMQLIPTASGSWWSGHITVYALP